MSDLATIDATAALESASDPGEFVVVALERGKTWLTEALQHGDLAALCEMKGWAATLRTATMQKQLGKDAELAATELVRRAERCIALGVRAGQEAGDIRRRGDDCRVDLHPNDTKVSPAVWLGGTGRSADQIRSLGGVADPEFEQAIEAAKGEGNLSRANVVRHVQGTKPKPADRHEIHRRAPRVNADRIIDESIAMLEGIASGLALIEDAKSLDAVKRLEWIEALRQPLAAINRFTKELRG